MTPGGSQEPAPGQEEQEEQRAVRPPQGRPVTQEVAAVAELLTLPAHHVVLALDVEHLVLCGATAGRHQALCKQPWSGGIMVTCMDSVC